jgi:hypothetical protein
VGRGRLGRHRGVGNSFWGVGRSDTHRQVPYTAAGFGRRGTVVRGPGQQLLVSLVWLASITRQR